MVKIRNFLFISLLALLSACSMLGTRSQLQAPKPESAQQKLKDMGVIVIRKGDDVKIVMKSDGNFYGRSPRLTYSSYTILSTVAEYIRQFHKINVKIAGYTDNIGTPWRDKQLTQQRAQNVADFLWSQGVDARLLYAVGYGTKNPIAGNQTKKGRGLNRRIEIILRKQTA